jgi:hypothetical protein
VVLVSFTMDSAFIEGKNNAEVGSWADGKVDGEAEGNVSCGMERVEDSNISFVAAMIGIASIEST